MRYTDEQLAFLREGFQTMTVAELTDAFNGRYGLQQARTAISSTLKRENIRRGRRILTGKRLAFTGEQIEFLRTNYVRLTLVNLAAAFKDRFGTEKTAGQIKSFIHNHGIKSGRTGCFEKGLKPWNRGVKGCMGANITSFRKGNVPKNRKPLGTERVNRDGYIEVKIPERDPYTGFPTRYKCKHVALWEQRHGPVLDGMCVVFRDGNPLNCVDANLILVSRAELLRLNHHKYREMPDDLKPTVLALVTLEVKTFELSKSQTGGEK
jgi:hypothetical protein